MNRGLYTSATGMISCQQALDVVANNLANATTNGYKQDGLIFGDMLAMHMAASGGTGEDIGTIGSGGEIKGAFTDLSAGNLTRSGNPLDLAVQGTGMFAVETSAGIRYTRDGSFSLRGDGTLITRDGNPVLDTQFKPIVIPPGSIQIGTDGSVKINRDTTQIAQIGLFQGTFSKVGGNLFESSTQTEPAVQTGPNASNIQQGCIEGSNVKPIIEMVNMIKLTRIFELSEKSAQSQDEASGKLLSMLQ